MNYSSQRGEREFQHLRRGGRMRRARVLSALLLVCLLFLATAQTFNAQPAYGTWPLVVTDGSKIAFSSNRDGSHLKIYLIDADGSNLTKLG